MSRSVSVLIAAFVLLAGQPAAADDATAHQHMVMEHGAMVMPFDQKVAMHMFVPSATGGVVEIVVHNMDPKQIALVRSHLQMEAARFRTGDFSDPAFIHGKTMPGLAALSSGSRELQVSYVSTPMGAAIALTSSKPSLVTAIHQWLAAQQHDHNGSSRKHCDMPM